ncbi:MAG: TonB-dependent receptor [Rhizobacter sp.]|nr:TonB-dependent receptor [Rhizobacter sp.]
MAARPRGPFRNQSVKKILIRHAALAAWSLCSLAHAGEADPTAAEPQAPVRELGMVVITGQRQGTLPATLPTTVEGLSGEEMRRTINATDSEDALKYLPSLLVRKRYAGDYNHAVLSTRASGTGNSARSLVYADGILLSNLLGNGASFAPRWGLVTPEEIERVDVLYGPFSAAFPGNSAGAVVDYVTRMPQQFEAHAAVGGFSQPFDLYDTHATYTGWQSSASVGSREGALAWWVNLNRLDSNSQPLVFTTRSTPVEGAVPALDRYGQPWYITGTSTQYHTVQDHLKLKLGYDLAPGWQLRYLMGAWQNDAQGRAQSYLDGLPAHVSNVDTLRHLMQALSLKASPAGDLSWELSASRYTYGRDRSAREGTGGATGTVTQLHGTGWDTLAWRATWHANAAHTLEGGLQQDRHRLRTSVFQSSDWAAGALSALASRFDGDTRLLAAYLQDAWRPSADWMAVAGLRAEQWDADHGLTLTGANTYAHPARREVALSPKLAVSRRLDEGWVVKASTGRALRFPTVSELYQGAATPTGISTIANPQLRPERSWTSELSSQWHWGESASLRVTGFHEDTRDALYSQPLAGSATTSSVQNVDHICTLGVEVAWEQPGLLPGLDLQGSVTGANSKIVANQGYVSVPGDTVGKWQPRVPRWRASALAAWHADERWTVSLGVRYSGVQYTSLDNRDVNGFAYQGSSRYLTADLRVRVAITRQWHAAFGIDNLNDDNYWNFHPYPQRTYSAELQFDL